MGAQNTVEVLPLEVLELLGVRTLHLLKNYHGHLKISWNLFTTFYERTEVSAILHSLSSVGILKLRKDQ